NFGRDLLGRVRVRRIVDAHGGAPLSQEMRDRSANAARAARHHRHLVAPCHCCSPVHDTPGVSSEYRPQLVPQQVVPRQFRVRGRHQKRTLEAEPTLAASITAPGPKELRISAKLTRHVPYLTAPRR